MMNRSMKIIIVIITILIITIIAILGILLKMKDNEIIAEEKKVDSTDEYIVYYEKLTKIQEKYEYFDIQTCVNNYINVLKTLNTKLYEDTINEGNKGELEDYIQNQEKILYNLLGKEYIEQCNITINNINKSFSKYYEINIFNINNMSGIDIDNNISIYVIDGQILYRDNTTEDYQFIVKKDAANLTYAIYPYEYITKNDNIDNAIQKLKEDKDTIVENKNDNVYYSQAYDDEYICKYYFNNLKNNIILNTNYIYIYNKLNEEYKEKRFPTLEKFKSYVEEKQTENIQLQQYLVEENKDNTINYVCKDQYDNLYIFQQTSIGEYTLTLDTYTLEQEKFTTEYTKANDQKKVMMNIDKFFQMINAKDYTAAYNVLADSFKNNYFKTEAAFKQYMKQRVYSYNDVTYQVFSDEVSGVYQYRLLLTDRTNKNNTTEFNIVMKLNGGTDFEMSFEV